MVTRGLTPVSLDVGFVVLFCFVKPRCVSGFISCRACSSSIRWRWWHMPLGIRARKGFSREITEHMP